MLNLTALEARSETSAHLDAKPPGERCFYSTRGPAGWKKTVWAADAQVPEVQGPWNLLDSIQLCAFGCINLYNRQSEIKGINNLLSDGSGGLL